MATSPINPMNPTGPAGPQDAPNPAGATYRCPKCIGAMRSYERNGITIEQCIECRGIFLDRGELESLMAAEAAAYDNSQAGPAQPYPAQGYPPAGYRDDRGGQHGGSHGGGHGSGYGGGGQHDKKRRGFLGELFD